MSDSNPSAILTDFPKIYCPFVRKLFPVNKDDWKAHGAKLRLKQPWAYLVTDAITEGYDWVFSDPDTVAVEKLDGTNIKILTKNGRLLHVQNRMNVIDPLQIIKGKRFIIEGIFNAVDKDYVELDGEQAGELIGPKLQGNPYKLDSHEWYPFEKAANNLKYKSFHEHERNFQNWSAWFKDHLISRFHSKRATKLGLTDKVMAEGVIFYNPRRRQEKKLHMAKLRRDMFDWYYSDSIKIDDYSLDGAQGRLPSENESFD